MEKFVRIMTHGTPEEIAEYHRESQERYDSHWANAPDCEGEYYVDEYGMTKQKWNGKYE